MNEHHGEGRDNRPVHPHELPAPRDKQQITLRGPAELADALPYMFGYHPTDSVVLVALHGDRGRFGGRLRLGIPASPQEWPPVAEQLAECLVEGAERHGPRPDGIVAFLCQDPGADETGRQVMERLRPLAQRLRTACGALDVPVYEALCISGGRYWSYCCPDERCCPAEGNALALPGTSVMAAAAAYAGIQVRGSLREMEVRLRPWPLPDRREPVPVGSLLRAREQEQVIDQAAFALFPRLVVGGVREQVRRDSLKLADDLVSRFRGAPAGEGWVAADAADDALVGDQEAADLIIGIQDRSTRDEAAGWMEGDRAGAALRLWRALARRCVGRYGEYAAAPQALAGWVAWSTGDEAEARVALRLSLEADPQYVFARLLHQACNQGMDPEEVRGFLRPENGGAEGRLPGLVPAGTPYEAEREGGGAYAGVGGAGLAGVVPQGAVAEPGEPVRADGPTAPGGPGGPAGCGAEAGGGAEPGAVPEAGEPGRARRRVRARKAAGAGSPARRRAPVRPGEPGAAQGQDRTGTGPSRARESRTAMRAAAPVRGARRSAGAEGGGAGDGPESGSAPSGKTGGR
ncbi:DUF4192 domain-containing protein [Streptomyces sp. NPDC001941]|uniref:DUF4192 domain-containing protein n=1 Tax=Streptomyces sp. NPDC001941 TaxID=3154659 RepID=UPI0033276F93